MRRDCDDEIGPTAIATRERDSDARDVFTRALDLPRMRDEKFVHDAHDREYTLRESESETAAAAALLP
jgi:hypothetical protein